MHYFFIIRYSILMLGQRSGWLLRRLDDRKYRRKLFDAKRLDLHQRLFLGLTLPSVCRQLAHADESRMTLVVLTSTELPQPWKENLMAALRLYPWALVSEIEPQGSNAFSGIPDIIRERCDSERYVTVRLDDDDALSADFLQQLGMHLDHGRSGFGISLSTGYAGFYEDGIFRDFRSFHRPMNSVGLATVHDRKSLDSGSGGRSHVFQMGRHPRVDQRLPTILDGRQPAYFRTIHAESDRYKQARRRAEKFPAVTEDEVVRCLGFSPVFD